MTSKFSDWKELSQSLPTPVDIETATIHAKAYLGSEDMLGQSGYDIALRYLFSKKLRISSGELLIFTQKFCKGYLNRPSVRYTNPSRTISDPLISKLVSATLDDAGEREMEIISSAHRMSMAAENIIGHLLEEYIHINAVPYNWTACWGTCIKSVDFCNDRGLELQVKNKNNTENSSSKGDRELRGTEKWYRMNANTGKTMWDTINQFISQDGQHPTMSEEGFQEFAVNLLKSNPDVIAVKRPEVDRFIQLIKS